MASEKGDICWFLVGVRSGQEVIGYFVNRDDRILCDEVIVAVYVVEFCLTLLA